MFIITRAAFKVEPEEREKAIKNLIESSYPGSHFFIMISVSAVISSVGLILNSGPLIIGSMLVAPFLAPVLSISLGVELADFSLLRRSFMIVLKSVLVVIVASAVTGIFANVPAGYTQEIISRSEPSLLYLVVAMAAGVAASFAIVKPGLIDFLVGVAISVSLIPPLAVTGLGLGVLDINLMIGSFELFLTNLLGVVFAGIIIFSLMGFYPYRAKAEIAIKEEEKKLEEEQNIATETK